MDAVDEFAIHLAERVAPDEVDLAPMIARSVIEKGDASEHDRKRSSSAVLGGFAPLEAISITTQILGGIASCVQVIHFFLERVMLSLIQGLTCRSKEEVLLRS